MKYFLLFMMPFLINGSTVESDRDFEIEMNLQNQKISLTCTQGCAWKTLSFDLSQDTSQAVDEFGMSSQKDSNTMYDPQLADFAFVVTYRSDKVVLEGINGTAWKELSYSCPQLSCSRWINKAGVRESR
ncbi:hypothetical protein [Croceiramulus getboli]|nr:hypothetical protein P8624_03720 [Flavobacteriaceae bacterium YJPT1-3]